MAGWWVGGHYDLQTCARGKVFDQTHLSDAASFEQRSTSIAVGGWAFSPAQKRRIIDISRRADKVHDFAAVLAERPMVYQTIVMGAEALKVLEFSPNGCDV
ncbi:hypothetical protein D9613_001383 [Agrocybe pediades]|uniref:Uncharacterized protein n=1 Tax=Agrocybe pediades TaxID=84607 RepID=A0A8H4VVA1_9AGAR|nr:hypothetical protein D9613_001383 [Agrocybe pediades]